MRVMVIVSFFLGTCATALSLYLVDASRITIRAIELSPLEWLFSLVPFIWIMLFVIAVSYGVHAVRETKRGYRIHTGWLVGGAVGASILCGAVVYSAGFGRKVDEYLLEQVPWYGVMSGFHSPPRTPGIFYGKIERDMHGTPFFHARGGMRCIVRDEKMQEGSHFRALGTTTNGGCEVREMQRFEGRMGPLDDDEDAFE
jgi:hypothetical protein